jgi:cytochrome c peroxidase
MVLAACAAIHAACAADGIVAGNYEWHLPPGFPPPAVPPNNPMSTAKVALGRRLFFETRLSSSGRYSCASCHRPPLAFTDGRAHAQGATGEPVRRSAMSLTNVAYSPAFTWSSAKVRSLEAQMRQPLFNEHPVEMGLKRDGAAAVKVLTADADYRAQFAAAFPGQPEMLSMEHIIEAIAAFERTLISGRSPFDRYVFDDDQTALSASAKRFFIRHESAAASATRGSTSRARLSTKAMRGRLRCSPIRAFTISTGAALIRRAIAA